MATLEELMAIEVTSASRREQRAEDAPAAVYVITRDEIRRSGLTSIPELLRLAPGVQVARINSNKWAVSVRGFNGRLYSNKLLVMVDGRSIYNPAFSTVLWDTEDLLVEDIDHIEVIRGPGGALWGANAVNGVVNVITRPATKTIGGLARVSVGSFETSSAAFRYGNSLRDVHYRLFAQGSTYGESVTTQGVQANDHWRSVTTGFRADWSRAHDALMFQGTATSGRQRPLWFGFDSASAPEIGWEAVVSETTAADVVGRWTRATASGSAFQAQAYFDYAHRDEAVALYGRRTWDVDAQYHTTIGKRHDLVGGGGYRYITESMHGRGPYTFLPNGLSQQILNAFAQDTIGLVRSRLELTVGAKFEQSTVSGPAFQPNVRLMWMASRGQRVWAAVARAVRTPSLIDLGLHVEYPAALAVPALRLRREIAPAAMPVLVGGLGNPDFQNERLINAEAGYRVNVTRRASFDLVAFRGRYDDLQTFEPLPPIVEMLNGQPVLKVFSQQANLLRADTRGAEVSGRVQAGKGWQVDGALATFHLAPHPMGSLDPSLPGYDSHAPAYQWRTHVALPLGRRGQADIHFFHTGRIDSADVPAITRLDVRAEWPLTRQLSLVASGQNLLHPSHLEFAGDKTVLESTEIPRSGGLRLVWRF
jgi:iron complex outermembrane receptor protein